LNTHSHIASSTCGLICVLLTCAHAPAQVRQNSETLLEVGRLVSASLDAGEAVTYRFEPPGDGNYVVEVEQKSVDVSVTLEAPDGTREVYDSPLEQDERELALIEHALAGPYRIVVESRALADSAGEYSVRLLALDTNGSRAAVSELEAFRQMRSAALHYRRGQAGEREQFPEAYAEAVRAYHLAADVWGTLGRSRDKAHALYSAAMIEYLFAWDWYGASRSAAEAARSYELSELPSLRANALFLHAMALTEAIHETKDKDALLLRIAGLLEESYAIHERLGNSDQLARIRYFNGLSNLNAGRHEQAKQFYVQAADFFATVNDWLGERKVLLDRAVIDIDLGNNLDAIEALEKLLELDAAQKQPPDQANFAGTVFDQIGNAYAAAQNIDAALGAFSKAREIHQQAGDLHGAAESLRGIANVYLQSGDLRLGRDFLSQAEVAARESSNGRILAVVQTALGHLAYSERDYELAKTFYSSALASVPDEGVLRADRQILLAKAYVALGQYAEARELAAQAIQAAQTAESPLTEADALRELGKAYFGLGDPTRSVSTLEQSISRYEQLDVADGLADAAHALSLALAEVASSQPDPARRVVQLDEALTWSARALLEAEGLLRNVVAPELRSYYAATHRQYYETRINLLMERYDNSRQADEQFVAEALATSERARARMTMDLLNEASVNLQQSVDPLKAAEIGRLLDDLARIAEDRQSILDLGGVDEATRTLLADLSNRAALIEHRIDILQTELRRDSAHYAALTAPSTVDLPEIQDLIDDDSVLLHYFLGDDKSFVWIVANDSIHAVEIANRATIDLATERALSSLRATPVYDPAANAEEKDALAKLAGLILEPFVELIGDKRLIIVADGALTYLPFQVLPFHRDGVVERLQESREIVALPSMSVLAALRNRQRAEPTKWLAAFADPVFERTDPRLSGNFGGDDAGSETWADVDRSFLTRSSLAGHLSRLPYTLREANAIAALVPDEAVSEADPLIAVGFDASRDKVLGHALEDYRFLHFATHGKVDTEIPALSALVLSRFNENGEPQDGYLRLDDIFSLKLNADLVVLSACETGLGTAILGEGFVGLTQGFLYAGARSLLVSLWDVPDRATAELMTRFYGQILDHGLSPAAALRNAQRSMSSDRRWSDPYYWGAFILSGDWQ
jgi:CHAT domain-containing protein